MHIVLPHHTPVQTHTYTTLHTHTHTIHAYIHTHSHTHTHTHTHTHYTHTHTHTLYTHTRTHSHTHITNTHTHTHTHIKPLINPLPPLSQYPNFNSSLTPTGVNLEAPAALYVNDSGSPSHHPLDSASLSSSSPLSEASSRKVRFTAQHYSDDLYDDTSTSALGELQRKMDQLRKKVENLNGGGISLSAVQASPRTVTVLVLCPDLHALLSLVPRPPCPP